MPPEPRRFRAPWSTKRTAGGHYAVIDANGLELAYVDVREERAGASAQGLTEDEARRIAANIARLARAAEEGGVRALTRLERNRTFDSVHDTAEFRQEAVAHQLEDAPMVLCNFRLEQLFAAALQTVEGAGLVRFHER